MENKGTITLETARLILRRFTPQDAGDMYRNWASDPEVTRYLRWKPHQSVEESREFLKPVLSSYERPNYYLWAIELKELHQVIGSINLDIESENDERGEFGYCLGRRFWRRGIMTEALQSLLQFGFRQLGLNRIEAGHSVRNPGSGRVMKKAGMLYEGCARQFYKSQSGFEDCDMYYLLKEDYFALGGAADAR
jgi:[ribosomal protein S5]-alanine N-acetyltransferase